jgi:hypothetical protein
MASHTSSPFLTCYSCGATTDRPADCQWSPLWDAGWRWIGAQDLFSCPPCPPVVVVREDGTHAPGPGVGEAK